MDTVNKSRNCQKPKKSRGVRVYLNNKNKTWIATEFFGGSSESKDLPGDRTISHNWIINHAMDHYRFSMIESLAKASRRFDPQELEVLVGQFKQFGVTEYFTNINDCRLVVDAIDRGSEYRDKNWRKAFHILKFYCPLDEINAICFKARCL